MEAHFLAVQPLLFRGFGRLGGPARVRAHGRFLISATSRASASARLRSWVRWFWARITITPSLVSRFPATRQRGSRHRSAVTANRAVEPELYRGRELVDILPAGAGGAHEALLDFGVIDGDVIGDADMASHSHAPRKRGTQ